jgi:hypothetical protein
MPRLDDHQLRHSWVIARAAVSRGAAGEGASLPLAAWRDPGEAAAE